MIRERSQKNREEIEKRSMEPFSTLVYPLTIIEKYHIRKIYERQSYKQTQLWNLTDLILRKDGSRNVTCLKDKCLINCLFIKQNNRNLNKNTIARNIILIWKNVAIFLQKCFWLIQPFHLLRTPICIDQVDEVDTFTSWK